MYVRTIKRKLIEISQVENSCEVELRCLKFGTRSMRRFGCLMERPYNSDVTISSESRAQCIRTFFHIVIKSNFAPAGRPNACHHSEVKSVQYQVAPVPWNSSLFFKTMLNPFSLSQWYISKHRHSRLFSIAVFLIFCRDECQTKIYLHDSRTLNFHKYLKFYRSILCHLLLNPSFMLHYKVIRA